MLQTMMNETTEEKSQNYIINYITMFGTMWDRI